VTASLLDHALFGDLMGDPEVAAIFSAETELLTFLAFEIELASAEAQEGLISVAAAEAIRERLSVFVPDRAQLVQGIGRDGVIGPSLVRQMRAAVGAPHDEAIHVGATSQDLVDTALMVRLKLLSRLFRARLAALEAALGALIERFGSAPLMGRTRMRAALPITVADRISAWWGPLHRARSELPPDLFAVQLGGPVGTLAELGDAGPAVRARLAAALDLVDAPCWHSQRDRVVRFADWVSHISGALGKLGQDAALMAQDGIGGIALSGAGGSSAMAHKHNPVAAEVLVALARYNAALVSALHQAQVHEQERSGAAWTLEWLALPQMAAATGAALRLALRLVSQIERMGSPEAGHG
jgi:3-carboxy-cis,cis-muconate cycloisomerase